MATVTTTQVIDDLDGTQGASTIRFSIGRSGYEIDLSEENVEKLYELLGPYISKARKATPPAGAKKRRRRPHVSQATVREWAKQKGLEVSDRGRISNDLIEQYHAAQS